MIKARLPAEQGALVLKALNKALDDQFNRRDDVSAETPDTQSATEHHIGHGPHVSAETSRRIGCDCSVIDAVENKSGEPLSIGRKSRSIPPAIRRALRFRDQGCRFLGCTGRKFVDGQHIVQWADGGHIVFTAPDERRLDADPPMQAIDEDPHAWFERELATEETGLQTCVPEY